MLDAGQIIVKVYDDTNSALACETIEAVSEVGSTLMSWREIIQKVYDADTNKLRIITV